MKPQLAPPNGYVHWVVRPGQEDAQALCGRTGSWSDDYRLTHPFCATCRERFEQMRKEAR